MCTKSYPYQAGLSFILSISFFFANFCVNAQTIDPEFINESVGVASSFVHDVIQDETGLLWLATDNGIQNYDGNRFRSFRYDPDNPNSLMNNYCWRITEDSKRNLWIGSDYGVSRYDRKTSTFTNYRLNQSDIATLAPGSEWLFFISEDSHKRLWTSADGVGLFQYDSVKDEWIPAQFKKHIKSNSDITRNIRALSEDQNGGLWIGSANDGLYHCKPGSNIFDYVPVLSESGIDFSKTEQVITALYADEKDQLWITTREGVYRMDMGTKQVETLAFYDDPYVMNPYTLYNAIREDADGNIWVANNFRGMLRFKDGGNSFEQIEVKGIQQMDTNAWNLCLLKFNIDKNGIFWFGTPRKGIMKYDPKAKPFSVYNHNPDDKTSIASNDINGIASSAKNPNKIYVALVNKGLDVMDLHTKEFEHFTWEVKNDFYGSGSARSFLELDDGHLLVGTLGEGIIEFDEQMKEVQRIRIDKNPQLPTRDLMRFLKKDSLGQIWVGTPLELFVWNRQTGAVKTIENRQTRSYSSELSKRVASVLSCSDSISILGVGDNVSMKQSFNVRKEGTWLVSNLGEGNTTTSNDYGWIENAAGDTLWSAYSGQNSFWAGGSPKNRVSLDAITLKPGEYILRYVSDGSHSVADGFNETAPNHPEWWGIAIAPVRDAELADEVKKITRNEDNRMVISGPNIMDIKLDNETAWVATVGDGLNQLNLKTNSVKLYTHDPGSKNSIASNNVNDLCIDREGSVWIATGKGLDYLNTETGEITHYTSEDGLPSNRIISVVEGKNGTMWMTTADGLSNMIINKELNKSTFINYFEEDGTGGDSYLTVASVRAADGTYFFAGEHGLTSFRPASENQRPLDIILTDLSISGKSVFDMGKTSPLENALQFIDEINLSHDQNNLNFTFEALSYSNLNKNQYAHKLEGFDAEWVYDNLNFATYTNLDPGNYNLLLRAANSYGVWNEESKSILVTILPPWWRTWWAYTVYGLIFIVLLIAFNKIMRKRVEAREQEKNRERELAQAKEIEKAYENLKAAQTQLIQSEKMASLGELTAGIAHEIQNPLNFVNNFSELNQELVIEAMEELEKQDYEETKFILKDIGDNSGKITHHGKRADAIIKGMLAHSRSGKGEKELTDINALADEYLRLSYHGLRAKDKTFNVDYKTDFDPDLPKVNVIPQDIGRVLLNLINNAFQACNEKSKNGEVGYLPKVTVITKLTANGQLLIAIKDNGHGIPDGIKDKIFQPFFTTKPTGQGTGLGLSMSYDIVKAHGGELKVESEEGKGTKFMITLVT